ncbi:recombinase family protein [Actinomycetospora atypica]|uniref:Recombinase family protein n=1 Tax=Actinomycetospora atypica TaxID=1290095 RepID=A0ABV9YI37_9PSEU
MARRNRRTALSGTAVGYLRVSTAEQADSGAGLDAQRMTIEHECARRGWTLVEVFEDRGVSGKSLDGRPALTEALGAVDDRTAAALVVAKLDRLSRSVHDAAGLLDRAQKSGWTLVASDLGVDTSTSAGEAMANVMATFGQLERRMISQRAKDALAARKAAGVKLGRLRTLPDEFVERVVEMREAGSSFAKIADALTAEDVATAQGGQRWYPSTVRAVLLSQR